MKYSLKKSERKLKIKYNNKIIIVLNCTETFLITLYCIVSRIIYLYWWELKCFSKLTTAVVVRTQAVIYAFVIMGISIYSCSRERAIIICFVLIKHGNNKIFNRDTIIYFLWRDQSAVQMTVQLKILINKILRMYFVSQHHNIHINSSLIKLYSH